MVRPYTLFIPIYGSWWGMACASDSLDPPAVDATTVASRLKERDILDLQYYCPEVHAALFALPRFQQKLLEHAASVIRKGETLIDR
jgi:spermidine synthase